MFDDISVFAKKANGWGTGQVSDLGGDVPLWQYLVNRYLKRVAVAHVGALIQETFGR